MTRRRRGNRSASLALGACCAILASAAYIEARYLDVAAAPAAPAAPVKAPVEPADHAAKVAPFSLPPLASLDEVVERPLFSESRRRPSTPPPAQVDRDIEALSLLGILTAPDTRHALIRVEPGRKPERVHEGDSLGGWTVEAILPDRVMFRRGDAREELKVKETGSPKGK